MQREKNMNSELENAFNKELNIIKNDLYYQQIERSVGGIDTLLRFDMFYKPMEILSGDSYSLRKCYDGKIVLFLIDAMGKGISASLTATSSTTLLNYIFNQMQHSKNFEFKTWIQRYIEYIKEDLLDNEMIAIVFAMYDRATSRCEYASFGMPAMLAIDAKEDLIKAKSNNMPISKYTEDFTINSIDVAHMKRILIYTDGLCENKLTNGEFYKNYLYEDFKQSDCITDFMKLVDSRLDDKQDDIAYFYINSVSLEVAWIDKNINGSRYEVDVLLQEVRQYVTSFGADVKCASEIVLAMSELLLNAVEHGLYGLSKEEKAKLIEEGEFDDMLDVLETKFIDKKISIKYCMRERAEKVMFIARISDFGKGFDVRELRQLVLNPRSFNGRGIMIARKLLDRFYYNEQGNSITIRKYLNINKSLTQSPLPKGDNLTCKIF